MKDETKRIAIDIPEWTDQSRPLSKEDMEGQVEKFLTALEPDELFAIAVLTRSINAEESLGLKRELLTKKCFEALTKDSLPFGASFEDIKDTLYKIIDSNCLRHLNDSNSLRAAKVLSIHIAERGLNNVNGLYELFPEAGYGRKNLLADLLYCYVKDNLPTVTVDDLHRWFSRQWLDIFNTNELKLRDDTKENRLLFLDELNTQLKKRAPDTPDAADYPQFLCNMDRVIGFDTEHRQLFIKKAKGSLSQKKNRKNGAAKQKNFILNKPTVKMLKKLAQTYQLSEAQVVSILINSEQKNPVHLAVLSKQLDVIAQATGDSIEERVFDDISLSAKEKAILGDIKPPSGEKDMFGDTSEPSREEDIFGDC